MERILVDEEIIDQTIEVQAGEKLSLRLAAFTSFPSVKITINLAEGAVFDGAFADFSRGSGTLKVDINLLSPLASATWNSACICGSGKKVFDVNINHKAPQTTGLMENYGIATTGGKLHFLGTSAIKHGAKGSSTKQSAKIIIFDPDCDGRCAPILKIDENDVKASHAAVVGKLSDEHIFYLCSRGLSVEQARRLITLGYLKPIEQYFEGPLKEKIASAIEGGI